MAVRHAARLGSTLGIALTLCGCGLVAAIIAIPFAIVGRIFSFGIGIRIGAENARTIEEELHASGLRIDRHEVDVVLRDDLTFEGTVEVDRTVTGVAGLAAAQRSEVTYDPTTQRVELLFGEVRTPDGTVIACDPSQLIDRPSSAAEDAPGFVATRTATVLFPQLSVGSQTHVKWRLTESGRSVVGFNYAWRTPFALPVERAKITIHHPSTTQLHWGERGGFKVDVREDAGTNTVEAVLEHYPGMVAERGMVAPRDVCPLFVASTVESRERIGQLFHQGLTGKVEVTPAIRDLAAKIVANRTGIEAARAIHRWVASNVLYLAIQLDEAAAWEPHAAEEVLQNGFGDCKDQVALLIALLASRDIAADAVLIDRQLAFEPLPVATPLEFDHCIAYLPEFDLYSDPTDPSRDLGELDIAMQDKLVVIATAEGRVSRTPAAVAEKNRCVVTHRAELRGDGTIAGHSTLSLQGRPASRLRTRLARAGDSTRVADDLLLEAPDGGTGSLTSTDPMDLTKPLVCEGDFESEAVVEMGDEILVPVPSGIDLLTPANARRFLSTGERRFPLVASAIDVEWTIEVDLPESHALTRLPVARSVENDAGSYSSRYEAATDRRLTVHRRLRVVKDRFGVAEVAGFQKLLREFLTDSHAVFVAKRK